MKKKTLVWIYRHTSEISWVQFLDHWNKMSITIKQVTQIYDSTVHVKVIPHCSLSVLYHYVRKTNGHTFIKKYFIAKKMLTIIWALNDSFFFAIVTSKIIHHRLVIITLNKSELFWKLPKCGTENEVSKCGWKMQRVGHDWATSLSLHFIAWAVAPIEKAWLAVCDRLSLAFDFLTLRQFSPRFSVLVCF